MTRWNHFNLLASVYERYARVPTPEPYSRRLGFRGDGWLLDAGGGTGRISQVLQDRVDKVIVGDEAAAMLRIAIAKPGLTGVQLATEALPFPTGSIDRILMVDALHHVVSQRTTTDELWRVLAVGGCLLIVEPDIYTLSVRLIAMMEKLAGMRSRFLTASQIAGLFEILEENHGGRPRITIEQEGHAVWVVVEKMVQ